MWIVSIRKLVASDPDLKFQIRRTGIVAQLENPV